MPPYGKNMRSCCDSVAERGRPHLKGCVSHRATGRRGDSQHFVQLDNSTDVVMMNDATFQEFLSQNDYFVRNDYGVHALASSATLIRNDTRYGIVLTVDYDIETEFE